jgi:endo-1,4-beta-xylanase
LDTVASAGLPIWITELSLASNDVHSRATALTDILTLYFSHPAVEGVLFWGFWDGKIFNQQTALFEGSDVMVTMDTIFNKCFEYCRHYALVV